MADYIRFSTDTFEALVDDLRRVSQRLSDVSAAFSGIDISREAGAELQCQASYRLHTAQGSVSPGTLKTLQRRMSADLSSLSTVSQQFARVMRNVSELVEEQERRLVARINGLPADETLLEKQSGNAPMTEEELARFFSDINLDTLLNLLRDCPSPDTLLGVLKMRDTSFFDKLFNGIWAGLNLDFRQIIQDPSYKYHYLFSKALNSGKDKEISIVPDSVRDMLNAVDLTKGLQFEDMVNMSKYKDMLDPQVFGDLYDMMKDNKISHKDFTSQLLNLGIPADQINGIWDEMDTYLGMDKVAKAMEGLDIAARTGEAVVDIYNQLQVVNAMDSSELMSMARVYSETGDAQMQWVGQKLSALAQADQAGRVAMIAGGELADLGLDLVSKGLGKAVENSLGNANPYTATIKLTTGVLDSVTGVNDVPRLTNEVLFAGDAAESIYNVFQKDLAAYNANPTDANLAAAVDSYNAYANAACTAQNACAQLYKNATDSTIGGIFVSQEAKGYEQMCKDSVRGFQKRSANIANAYVGYQNGTEVSYI